MKGWGCIAQGSHSSGTQKGCPIFSVAPHKTPLPPFRSRFGEGRRLQILAGAARSSGIGFLIALSVVLWVFAQLSDGSIRVFAQFGVGVSRSTTTNSTCRSESGFNECFQQKKTVSLLHLTVETANLPSFATVNNDLINDIFKRNINFEQTVTYRDLALNFSDTSFF